MLAVADKVRPEAAATVNPALAAAPALKHQATDDGDECAPLREPLTAHGPLISDRCVDASHALSRRCICHMRGGAGTRKTKSSGHGTSSSTAASSREPPVGDSSAPPARRSAVFDAHVVAGTPGSLCPSCFSCGPRHYLRARMMTTRRPVRRVSIPRDEKLSRKQQRHQTSSFTRAERKVQCRCGRPKNTLRPTETKTRDARDGLLSRSGTCSINNESC